jgi:uncharacterized protein (UPF0335 family)
MTKIHMPVAEAPKKPVDRSNTSTVELQKFVERIERLESEKKDLGEDIREVYKEVKGSGFNAKVLRKVVALRRRDADERKEETALIESYLSVLGIF